MNCPYNCTIWVNLPTGLILLAAGFLLFMVRSVYVDYRKHKKLKKALWAEIKEIRVLNVSEIDFLKQQVQNNVMPFIVLDRAQSIFNAHQNDLSLLDKNTLEAVVQVYIYDRFICEILSRFQETQFKEMTTKRKKTSLNHLKTINESLEKFRSVAKDRLSRPLFRWDMFWTAVAATMVLLIGFLLGGWVRPF